MGAGDALHLPANRFEPGLREKKLLSLGSPRVGVDLQGPLPRSSGGAESGTVATPLPSSVRCGAGAQRPDQTAAQLSDPTPGTLEPDRRVQVCPSLGSRAR